MPVPDRFGFSSAPDLVIFSANQMSSPTPNHTETTSRYILGYSEQEQKRLLLQATVLREWTERFFRAAQLAPGMHVLDVGCGMGDVSLLAGEMVGPTGSVLGLDRDGDVLGKACERIGQHGCASWVQFQQAEISEFRSEQLFDAVVGRYILHHQQDPTAVLRHLATQVRPGGLLIFHEFDFGSPVAMWPEPPPLWRQTIYLVAEVFRRSGLFPDFGLRLTRTFLDAGLPWPAIRAEVPVGGEPGSYMYDWLAQTVCSLLPLLEKLGLATEEELQVGTLAARLEAEVVSRGCQLIGPTQFGAWVRKP